MESGALPGFSRTHLFILVSAKKQAIWRR
jgi:hypothetical protein